MSELNKERVYDLQLLPLFERIIVMGNACWKVDGFDDEYYMGAKASACKVIWNLSIRHDVEKQCPDVLNVLQTFLTQVLMARIVLAAAAPSILPCASAHGWHLCSYTNAADLKAGRGSLTLLCCTPSVLVASVTSCREN